jgi:hypothetical protein
MTLDALDSPAKFLLMSAGRWILRHPHFVLSATTHATVLALLYYFGSYQPEMRQQEAEVASSMRATSMAGTAKRLRDLETIKKLLEKSANRAEPAAESSPDPEQPPETPEDMVERARELAQAIDALDQQIRAEELAMLLGEPEPPPVADETSNQDSTATAPEVTPEMAAREIAALEEKARATLAARQERLEARAHGVRVEGQRPHAGQESANTAAQLEQREPDMAVRGEIADFIRSGESTEQIWQFDARGGEWIPDSGEGGAFQIPAMDATGLVRGKGRLFGAGGQFANRVYLNTWYIIGPFQGRPQGGLFGNPGHPPENAVLLDAVYFGKADRLLKWRYVSSQAYPLIPPDPEVDAVYYGYTEVSVDQDCDLTAWIGADDDVQIYLNDRLVWKGGNIFKKLPYFYALIDPRTTHARDYNISEGKRVLHFNKGRNKLFFKLSNGPQGTSLSFVLTP